MKDIFRTSSTHLERDTSLLLSFDVLFIRLGGELFNLRIQLDNPVGSPPSLAFIHPKLCYTLYLSRPPDWLPSTTIIRARISVGCISFVLGEAFSARGVSRLRSREKIPHHCIWSSTSPFLLVRNTFSSRLVGPVTCSHHSRCILLPLTRMHTVIVQL